MLFNRLDTPELPLPIGLPQFHTPCNTCVMDPPDSAFKTASRDSIGLAVFVFAQLTAVSRHVCSVF